MKFLFPSQPGDSSIPDISFEKEFGIVSELKDSYLIDIVDLLSNQFDKAVRRVSKSESYIFFLYRGWMLSKEQYFGLESALKEKNGLLLNSVLAYEACHYMNCYYPIIQDITPKTLFIDSNLDSEKLYEICKSFFSAKHLFLKDTVSSQKYLWKTASYIEDFSNSKENFIKVVENFKKFQKEYRGQIQSNLVFREFIPLKKIGQHKLGMPFSQEFRSFVYKGKIISTHKYWASEADYLKENPPKNWLKKIASKIFSETKNNFFSLDTALTENNEWIVIEIGDGQVSSIKDENETDKIYNALAG